MSENEIPKCILDAAFVVHSKLGPGLLESAYEVVLAHELRKRGLGVERQKAMPIEYDGILFDEAYRADLVIDSKVLVEIKSVSRNDLCTRKTGSDAVALKRAQAGTADQFRRGPSEE